MVTILDMQEKLEEAVRITERADLSSPAMQTATKARVEIEIDKIVLVDDEDRLAKYQKFMVVLNDFATYIDEKFGSFLGGLVDRKAIKPFVEAVLKEKIIEATPIVEEE